MRCVLACANKVITRTLLLFHFINFPCGASRKLRSERYKCNIERLTLLSRALETAPKLSNVRLPLT